MATKIKLVTEDAKQGSNQPPDEDVVINTTELRKDISEIEDLIADKNDINSEIKDKLTDMKARGYDLKTVRALIRLRAMDQEKRKEAEAVLDLYKHALDMD